MDRKEAINILAYNAINATGTLGALPPTARETKYLNEQIKALNMAIEALQEQERKKGCWKRCHKYEFVSDKWGHRCSECGHEISDEDSSVIKNFLLPNFCEFCGADMRGEEE